LLALSVRNDSSHHAISSHRRASDREPPTEQTHSNTSRCDASHVAIERHPQGDSAESVAHNSSSGIGRRPEAASNQHARRSCRRTTVMLATVAGSSPFSSGASITVGPDGRFGIAGQPPGRYALNARVGSGATALSALAVIDTYGNDVASAQLVLRPALTLPGRLTATATGGAKPPALAGLRLQLAGLSAAHRTGIVPQVSPATVDGTFTISGVMPGRYTFGGAPFFGASGDSVTWGLASVFIDGADVTDRAFDISAETPPKEVVATITDQWQEISGRVTNAAGASVSDYTMLAFPVDEAYWLHNSRRIVTAQPAGDGRYQLGGPGPALLPAGEYYLATVTDVSKDEQYDPAFLKALVPTAIKVTLGAGERKTQDVRVQ